MSDLESFYSQPRFSGTAESVIGAFTLSLRGLLSRAASDLSPGRRGRYAGPTEAAFAEPLAANIRRGTAHTDALEAMTLRSDLPPGTATLFRAVLANVLNDSGFIEAAQTHNQSPPADESKFDEHRGGDIMDSLGDIADKLWQLADIFPPIALLLNLVAVVLRDVGLLGKLTETVAENKIAEQVEAKLLDIIDYALMLPEVLDKVRATQQTADRTDLEVQKIESKADSLASLLGRTLVSESWVVDPSKPGFTSNKVPAKGVKDELHDIEDLLTIIVNRLPPTVDPVPVVPDGDPSAKFDKPPQTVLPVVLDGRIKKIFVWAQNTFAPANANDRRVIEVQTGAFDLSGWLDLTSLRPGDQVEVQVAVSIAGRAPATFAQTVFDQPGLKPFADFCRGLNYVSGNNMRITLMQPASADAFATIVEFAYQFIVESM